jgi:ribosome-associated protein
MVDSIVVDPHVHIPASAIQVSAVRASGPGGQNVNKVSSKVELRVDVAQIEGLDDAARARLIVLSASRMDAGGMIRVVSQKGRDRIRNLEDACEKIRALVAAALVVPKPRRKTRPSRGAVQRRLNEKRETSDRKRNRQAGRQSPGDD